MKYVYILKAYIRKEWILYNIYSTRAKAQKMASELCVDVLITKWPVK